MINQLHGLSATGVFCAFIIGAIVLQEALVYIRGDAGIQGIVGTTQDVNKPG